MMMRVFLALIMISSYAANATDSEKLTFTKGTMSAGGSISFPIDWDPMRQTSFSLNISPEFGYFVRNGLQLLSRAHVKSSFYTNGLNYGARDSQWNWGVGIGFEYLFTVKWPVIPFVGFSFDFDIAGLIETTARAVINVPFGVLVPLNKNIALTFGMATHVYLVAQLKVLDRISFEPGYLGVKAFF